MRQLLLRFFSLLKNAKRYVRRLREQGRAPALDTQWAARTAGRKSYLMLCHDQDIDRRIIQEAQALQKNGWVGILIACSQDQYDRLDTVDGVTVHRIGMQRISMQRLGLPWPIRWLAFRFAGTKARTHAVPSHAAAQRVQGRAFPEILLKKTAKVVFRVARGGLQLLWLLRYGSRHGTPLFFDNAFFEAARHYRASVVQAHDLPALKTAAGLAAQWHVPLVYDAHEFYPEQTAFSPRQKAFMFRVEGKYIRRCDAFFIVNNSLGGIMARRYGIPAPAELTNALDPPADLRPEADLFRKEFGLAADAPVILLQGGLAPTRNQDALVRAMGYLRHPRAVLVIMGNGDYGSTLRKIAEMEVPPGRVFFKEAVPQDELLRWTCTASIGIIPYPALDINTTYCTPNKLFEYIQAGLPILANDLPELRRFVQDTGFGRVTRMESPQDIAEALDAMLADPDAVADMKAVLKARREEFSWSRQAKKYVAVMEGLIHPPLQYIPEPDNSKTGPAVLLVAFFTEETPQSVMDNLFEQQRLSRYPTGILNVRGSDTGRKPPVSIEDFDVFFYHCTLTYSFSYFRKVAEQLHIPSDSPTVIMKQDESRHVSRLVDYLKTAGPCLLLTCVPPAEREKVYPRAALPHVSFMHTLTGYVTKEMRALKAPPLAGRPIDVSYRGSVQPFVFGQLSYEKQWLAAAFSHAVEGRGLTCDISCRWEDRVYGDAWTDLLMRSRAVLGVESGASVFDFDGTLEEKCANYEREHPGCTFTEVQERFLLPYENNVHYGQVSPRHFEAAACRCVQILLEGDYSTIFQADRHYLSLKRDFSNLDSILKRLQDTSYCQAMVDRAFDEIILNPHWWYSSYIAKLDGAVANLLTI